MQEMNHLLEVVRAVRNVRHSSEPRVRRQPAEISSPRALLAEPVGRTYLATLAQLDLNGKLPEDSPVAVVVVGPTTVRLGLQAEDDTERKRLGAELKRTEELIASIEEKLNNPKFTGKAPREVVERERARLAQAGEAAERLRRLLGEEREVR